jgi:hypothetical protein
LTVELASAAGVEPSLAVADGGWLAGVSTGAGVALGSWVDGTVATAPVVFASEFGVVGTELGVVGNELGAGSALEVGVLLVELGVLLEATEPCVSALTLAVAGAEREADTRLERLEVLLLAPALDGVFAAFVLSSAGGGAVTALRLGACWVVAPASASVAAVSATAGVEAFGPERLAFATIEGRVADGGAAFFESLRL